MESTDSSVFKESFKEILLHTFQETIKFLNDHNLRWWAAFGTMLGAVRHRGMIPWDDDIDLYMPREDYNKLIALRQDMKSTILDINTYNDEGYIYPFAKVVNKNTTLWEMKQYPHITGVYIDIFAIDRTNADRKDTIQQHRRYKHAARRMMLYYSKQNICEWYTNTLKRGFPWTLDWVISLIKQRRAVEEFKQIDNSLDEPDGKYWVRYNRTRRCDFFEKEWFDSDIDMPFENFTVKVPCGYHHILTQEYGDYMTPPPVDKRASIHRKYYINLKERLTMDEVRRRMEKGERMVF